MFFDDHRRAVTTIIGRRNSKGDVTMSRTEMQPQVHLTEDHEPEGRHIAAQEILAAHNDKNPAKLMEALGNFIDLHMHAEAGNKPEPTEHEGKDPNRAPLP